VQFPLYWSAAQAERKWFSHQLNGWVFRFSRTSLLSAFSTKSKKKKKKTNWKIDWDEMLGILWLERKT